NCGFPSITITNFSTLGCCNTFPKIQGPDWTKQVINNVSYIRGQHVHECSDQVWLLGDEWIDAAASRDRNLRERRARSVPRPWTQTAGRFSDERNEDLGAAQRAVPVRGVQRPQQDSIHTCG